MSGAATEPQQQSYLATFVQGLRKLGWIDGQNLQTEVRWSAADTGRMDAYATDLVGLFKPDVLLTATTANLAALQRATRTIPIVFTQVSDPVEQGFVPNLARPGGNITGFASPEFSIAGKWADLLKQMAPSIARVALVFNPEASPQSRLFLSALEAAAPSLGVAAQPGRPQSPGAVRGSDPGLLRGREHGRGPGLQGQGEAGGNRVGGRRPNDFKAVERDSFNLRAWFIGFDFGSSFCPALR
jgi:putative ABC transport system substrate-binding protein